MPDYATAPATSICILAESPTWLAACLDSTTAQTSPPPEIIVVDWSAAATIGAICAAKAGVRHLLAQNADEALVMAIANSHGRYVRLLRDSDLLAPDAMEPLVAAIRRTPETRMAFALAMQIDAQGKQLGVDQKIQFGRTAQLLDGNTLRRQLAQTSTNLLGPLSNVLFDGPWLREAGPCLLNGKQPGHRYRELRDVACYCKAAADRPVAFVPAVLSSCRKTDSQADTLATLTEWRTLIDDILPACTLPTDPRAQAIRTFNNRLADFASTHDTARTTVMQLRFADTDDPEFAEYQRCRALLDNGRLKDALSPLLALAEQQTSCWQVYESLADIALVRHDDGSALAYLEAAAHKAIMPGPVTLKLATLLIGSFRLAEGRTHLQRYLACYPDDHQALALLNGTDSHSASSGDDIDAATLNAYACLTGDYAAWARHSAGRRPPVESTSVFEFIVTVPGDSAPRLADTIDTIAAQQGGQWHLSVLAEFAAPDPSLSETGLVSWFVCDGPGTFSASLAKAVASSSANWLVITSAGTCFSPDYLVHLRAHIRRHPQHELVYTDDDHLDSAGNRCLPRFKPDFDPDYFRAFDYIRDIAVRRETLHPRDLATLACGAETYDIVLEVLERCGTVAIAHLDQVLVHIPLPLTQRTTPEGGMAALRRHLEQTGQAAAITSGAFPYLRRIVYRSKSTPLVSLIVCVAGSAPRLETCIDSLFRHTAYANWELIVAHRAGDAEAEACALKFADNRPGRACRWIAVDGADCLPALANAAARAACGDYLLLLDPQVEAIADDWLDRMMAHAQRPEIGVTAARLISPGRNHLVHAGLVLGLEGSTAGAFADLSTEQPGYLFRAVTEQRYSAVSAACLLVRRADYLTVGGMDESYRRHYADADLCLKLRQRDLTTLWLPDPTLVLHPTQNQDLEAGAGIPDAYRLFRQWPTLLSNDPTWNRNLSLSASQPVIEHELVVPNDLASEDHQGTIIGMPIGPPSVVEYRVSAPLRALDAANRECCLTIGLHNHDSASDSRLPRVPTPVELARLKARAVLIHTPVDDARLIALLHYRELHPDVLRIYSLDDLVTDIPPDNPTGLNLPPEVLAERLRIGAGACQRGIVSTEPLAALLRQHIVDVRVVPNMLERSRWGALASSRRNGLRPRVGWAGAQQHAGDLRFILDVVAATHREVDWVFFGMMPEGAESLIAEFHPYVRDFDAYPARLAALDLDLAIAPLAPHPFNEAKSNLRLLEYGILGWPVICTDIFPYRTNNPPVTRLANDARTWIAAVRQKIANRAALAREGDALRRWVLDNYILEDHLDRWQDALQPYP